MENVWDRLFSDLGYEALDVIFDLNCSGLQETELKKLCALAAKIGHSSSLGEQVSAIIHSEEEEHIKLTKLLSLG